MGCVAGGLGCLGLFNALEADETVADTPPAAPPALQVTVGPRFDFYTVLPNQELDLNPDIEPADLQSGNTSSAQYLLQVGSFRQQADADRRRCELALLGLEATEEPGTGDNGRWNRVYLGPIESRSEMARARLSPHRPTWTPCCSNASHLEHGGSTSGHPSSLLA